MADFDAKKQIKTAVAKNFNQLPYSLNELLLFLLGISMEWLERNDVMIFNMFLRPGYSVIINYNAIFIDSPRLCTYL